MQCITSDIYPHKQLTGAVSEICNCATVSHFHFPPPSPPPSPHTFFFCWLEQGKDVDATFMSLYAAVVSFPESISQANIRCCCFLLIQLYWTADTLQEQIYSGQEVRRRPDDIL